jgi:hypothetical protein
MRSRVPEGCSSPSSESAPYLVSALELEQRVHRLVIGKRDGAQLDYLDRISTGVHRHVLYTRENDVDVPNLALKNNPEMRSSDGRWKAHCEVSLECTIRQTASPHKSFSLRSGNVASPLLWSPNGDLVLFARECDIFRTPVILQRSPVTLQRSPEWEAIIYDLRTGREIAVGTFGGSDPYDGLRWYQLTLGD